MEIRNLTKDDFESAVSQGTVLVDFWAGWCMPCKMLAPVIDELAEAFKDTVQVAKVDIDAENALALQHGIMSIPTVVLFQGGREVRRFVGVQPKETYQAALEAQAADEGTP